MSASPFPGGVWSATPTPFTANYRLDTDSVARLVEQHVRLGVSGLMLAGTCGEGAWMRDTDRERLTRLAVEAAENRLAIAIQVTDNSALRTLDNIERAREWGAGIAVVEAPYFLFNATPARLAAYYHDVARKSVLPIGYYDRGAKSPFSLPPASVAEFLAHPNVVIVKDSSGSRARCSQFLDARRRRADLRLLSGNEFDCVSYLRAGYDGLLLGGAIFNGAIARGIIAAVRAGDDALALTLQERMNDLMDRVYGGPNVECWLSGLKELLVQMGVFSTNANLLEYPLTEQCRAQIRAAITGSDGMGFADDLAGRNTAAPLALAGGGAA